MRALACVFVVRRLIRTWASEEKGNPRLRVRQGSHFFKEKRMNVTGVSVSLLNITVASKQASKQGSKQASKQVALQ